MLWAELSLVGSGLALLFAGAETLVRGAVRLALALGIPPVVIGLTIVAFGTSAPELAVSVGAAMRGQADISLGNAVGSNIFNVLFILGLCAVITPLRVAQQLIWLDVPLMIGASLLLLLMGIDGAISRIDGVLLFGGAVAYTLFAIRQGRKESGDVEREYAGRFSGRESPPSQLRHILYVVVGIAMLVWGAHWLVAGASRIARLLGMSDFVIGLTIVAAGTSLPEAATSIVASFRGQREIAVANVVGSNLFNILAVLGLTGLVAPHGISVPASALAFDIPVMIAVMLACAPIFFTGHLIARWEGLLFLLYYFAYAAYLVLDARGHDSLPVFDALMLQFVLPLTLITLAVAYIRHAAAKRS